MNWWIVALLAGVVLSGGVGLWAGRPISRTRRDVVRRLRARYPDSGYPLRWGHPLQWPNDIVIVDALLRDVDRLAIAEDVLRKTFADTPVPADGGTVAARTGPIPLTPTERAYLTWLVTSD